MMISIYCSQYYNDDRYIRKIALCWGLLSTEDMLYHSILSNDFLFHLLDTKLQIWSNIILNQA